MLWFYGAYCNHSNWCRIVFINSISRGKGARGSCFDVSFVGLEVETWRIMCFSGSKVSQFILSISLVTSSMNSRLFPFFLFHLLISRIFIFRYIHTVHYCTMKVDETLKQKSRLGTQHAGIHSWVFRGIPATPRVPWNQGSSQECVGGILFCLVLVILADPNGDSQDNCNLPSQQVTQPSVKWKAGFCRFVQVCRGFPKYIVI